ncbi:MAG: ROK family protein [Candidatus Heimdallarchaeota archaeon]|nr:MAG: ROK family protein [Candidatus Heimdallarchaeota archaeon]
MSPDTNLENELFAIGVDVGGTKISSAIINSKGKIVFRIEEPTIQGDTTDLMSQIAKLIQKGLDRSETNGLKIKGIGIACATLVEKYDDKIEWETNIPQIQGSVLTTWLQENLGKSLPIFAVHDHVTPILGEEWVGVAREAKNAIYIILGTGIGSSILLDGKPYDGVGGLAGSIGWTLLGPSFMDKVYDEGCFESFCSGTGIARRVIEEIRRGSKTILMDMVNNDINMITSELIFEATRKGDPLALKIVQETAVYLGIVVSNLISTLAPEIVVIGGGVGQSAELFLDRVIEIVTNYSQRYLAKKVEKGEIRILSSSLGGDASLYGAAKLVFMFTDE